MAPKINLKERLDRDYRLTLRDQESHEEVASYNLTLMNLYVIISSILFFTTIILFLLIVFTPLKKYVPGYGEMGAKNELIYLNSKLDSLSLKLNLYENYNDRLKRRLSGESVEVNTNNELLGREIEVRHKLRNSGLLNKSESKNIEDLYFMPPLEGQINNGYHPEKNHFGVDILAPKDTPIKAVMEGVVFFSDWTAKTGNTIGIIHKSNLISFYMHNSELLKKKGDKVKSGEAIAIIGNSGEQTTGTHLHFELWHEGFPLNPESYIIFD